MLNLVMFIDVVMNFTERELRRRRLSFANKALIKLYGKERGLRAIKERNKLRAREVSLEKFR